MAALPDARTANHAVRIRLQSASIRVAGMFTYKAEDVFNPNNVETGSGAFLPVGSNDTTNPTIRPLDLPGDPQFGELVLADHRASIKEALKTDQLPPIEGPVHSPTEILARERKAEKRMGTSYMRLIEEVGRPVLRAATSLLAEAGQLPEVAMVQPALPDGRPAPMMLDGRDVKVQFTSPMGRAQQLAEAETIVQWAEFSIRTAGQMAWEDAVKTEDIPADLQKKMGAPPQLVRTDEERAERAEERREAMMAQQQPAMQQGQPMEMGP